MTVDMMKNETEQRKDELIGQAVLDLLRQKKAVTVNSLCAQLQVMQRAEHDARKRTMLAGIIEELTAQALPDIDAERFTSRRENACTDDLTGVGKRNGRKDEGSLH